MSNLPRTWNLDMIVPNEFHFIRLEGKAQLHNIWARLIEVVLH